MFLQEIIIESNDFLNIMVLVILYIEDFIEKYFIYRLNFI